MSDPSLYVFGISHYCEKARWALDYVDLRYQLKMLPPGPHLLQMKKLGAAQSSVPLLEKDGELVQGSTKIIDWVIEYNHEAQQKLVADGDQQLANEIESRMNKVGGIHVRRYFYSEALLDQPALIRALFGAQASLLDKCKIRMLWPKIRSGMIRHLDLGQQQRLESRAIVEAELDWLDGLLDDGRDFFAGGSFSRVDISVASLLSPLVLPEQHPVYANMTLPPLMQQEIKLWQQRPTLRWLRRMYQSYR